MDPLSIIGLSIGGASLLTSLGFGVANATKSAPTIPGASSGERLAAASSRQLANKLQTGQGLSDTAYNARIGGASDVAAGQAGQAAGAIRGNPFMPGVIANRIVKEAFQKGGQYMAKTQQDLTLTDIEAALSNLKAGVQAESVAGQMAANVSEKDQRAAEYKLRLQTMKEQALGETLFGVAKGTAGLMGVAGKLMANQPAEPTLEQKSDALGIPKANIPAGTPEEVAALNNRTVTIPYSNQLEGGVIQKPYYADMESDLTEQLLNFDRIHETGQ
jgi:hypothetical protein